jgi:leucyl-tRNA synthetase
VQVGGKFRGTVEIEKAAGQQQIVAEAMKVEQIARHLVGKTVVKEIFVPGKIINFIVK